MMPGPPKITLDQESFKALASEVRVGVLKKLDERRQTLTDLSGLLDLSKPTLLEHLEKLQAAGLVKRLDEGRKWIYYELSAKGRKVLHPERVAITLALSAAVVLAAIGAFYLLSAGSPFLAPRSPLANTTAGPRITETFGGSSAGFGILAIALSVVSAIVVIVLHVLGRRRRERFFEQFATG